MAKYEDFLNLNFEDVQKMTESELREVVKVLSPVANRRLTNLEKIQNGEFSPAYQTRNGKRFSVKDKTLNQLRNEFKSAQRFLNMSTSTLKGFTAYQTNIRERIDNETVDLKNFFKAYRELERSMGSEVLKQYGSENVMRMVAREMDIDNDVSLERLENQFREMYENQRSINDNSWSDVDEDEFSEYW